MTIFFDEDKKYVFLSSFKRKLSYKWFFWFLIPPKEARALRQSKHWQHHCSLEFFMKNTPESSHYSSKHLVAFWLCLLKECVGLFVFWPWSSKRLISVASWQLARAQCHLLLFSTTNTLLFIFTAVSFCLAYAAPSCFHPELQFTAIFPGLNDASDSSWPNFSAIYCRSIIWHFWHREMTTGLCWQGSIS